METLPRPFPTADSGEEAMIKAKEKFKPVNTRAVTGTKSPVG